MEVGFPWLGLCFPSCVWRLCGHCGLLLQAQAGLQRGRQQPTPQRDRTVTCLVSLLNLQTRGRLRERESERERERKKERKRERSNKGSCERAQGLRTPRLTNWRLQGVGETVEEIRKPPDPAYTAHLAPSNVHAERHGHKHMHKEHKYKKKCTVFF